MKCPYCHSQEYKVTDTREASDVNAIRRRRECLNCLRRFTTFETIELTLKFISVTAAMKNFSSRS